MRLIIKRNQQAMKGMLGGHKGVQFTLICRLDLTAEESQLMREYKLEDYPLTYTSYQGQQIPSVTLGGLLAGTTETLVDVTTLVNNEAVIKKACDELPTLFDVVRTFGGEEVIEYPRS